MSGYNKSILIVDDDKSIQSLLSSLLSKKGYKCDCASDGIECISKSANNNYDLILLDVNMPNLDGIGTIRKLNERGIDTSVVVLSASRSIDDVKAMLKSGAYDYLFKPFNLTEIDNTIKRAIERSILLRENKSYQNELEHKVINQANEIVEMYAETLEGMVLALDMREQETGYHSYRVTEYSLTLGRKMGLSQEDLSIIVKGALLHDIGKIGIPDSILLKTEQLDQDEWNIMKKHPVLGYNLLKKINFLEHSAQLVLTHHERYDGNGYPNNLPGNDIPIGARIFSVVDALDAMTSERSYNKAITFEQALSRIEEASGTQFDPEVIKYFVEIPLSKWKDIRSRIELSGISFLKNMLYNVSKKAV